MVIDAIKIICLTFPFCIFTAEKQTTHLQNSDEYLKFSQLAVGYSFVAHNPTAHNPPQSRPPSSDELLELLLDEADALSRYNPTPHTLPDSTSTKNSPYHPTQSSEDLFDEVVETAHLLQSFDQNPNQPPPSSSSIRVSFVSPNHTPTQTTATENAPIKPQQPVQSEQSTSDDWDTITERPNTLRENSLTTAAQTAIFHAQQLWKEYCK